jgi:transcriptional regulator of heat shock response
MGRIEEIFDQVNIDYSNMSEDEKIDKILRVLLYNIINKTMEKISDNYITPVESIFGVSEEKDKIMNSLMKNAKRFVNDPEKYYLYQQKNMRRISRNVIQKISKIYSLLESKKNSITNWDAYLKYYVGKTPIDTEVKTYHKKRI